MTKPGQPEGWNERSKSKLTGVELPEGAEFYVTPAHGYLRVDIRKHPAQVSDYDYVDGPDHVLLEEDCSLAMWLAEMGLVPLEDYMRTMQAKIPRRPACSVLRG